MCYFFGVFHKSSLFGYKRILGQCDQTRDLEAYSTHHATKDLEAYSTHLANNQAPPDLGGQNLV